MPIYSLGEKKPQLPENNLYWVAPDAHVIGNVILGKDVGISPAKAVRELSQEMIENMTRSSKHYVANFKKFAEEMREIK